MHPSIRPPPPSLRSSDRYAKRKLREAFHENAGLKGEEAAAALAKAKTEAEVMKRQVEVYKMFGSAQKSVVELTGRNGVKKP